MATREFLGDVLRKKLTCGFDGAKDCSCFLCREFAERLSMNIDAVFLALARFASDGAKSVVGRRLLGNRRELAESISSRLMAYDCEMHTSIGYGRIVADLLLGPSTKREAIRGTNGE